MTILLTEEQAAARLLVSPRTLRDIRQRGEIHYVALTARKIGYRPEDCDEYVSARVRVQEIRKIDSPPGKRKPSPSSMSGNVVRFSQRKRAG